MSKYREHVYRDSVVKLTKDLKTNIIYLRIGMAINSGCVIYLIFAKNTPIWLDVIVMSIVGIYFAVNVIMFCILKDESD